MTLPWLLESGQSVPNAVILLLALAADAAVGDPNRLYRVIPHPVVLIGRLVKAGDLALNRPGLRRANTQIRGGVLVVLLVGLAAALGWAIAGITQAIPGGWLIEAASASTLIAFRGLHDHVRSVATGLDIGLAEARASVAHIVGRDPDSLDEAGIARAAIESAAENFSDGVVAPVFWFALLGLPGLCAYKAINTLDSMIGHRNDRYEAFGKAAARLDDAANWVPARLSALLLILAAAILPGACVGPAWRALRRDAPRHRSPNAGWPEAALAGALGFALGGPRRYGGTLVEDHWMGNGRKDLGAGDIRRALALYLGANAVLAVLLALPVLL